MLRIVHPDYPVNNLPVDDVFLIKDDMDNVQGTGYIVYQLQPHLYPDCPLNLYFHMDCQPAARYMLLGALIARARQLRNYNQDCQARLYTNVDPRDEELRAFYRESGLELESYETWVQIMIPMGDGRIPMSCTVAAESVNTMQEQAEFIQRLQQNDVTWVTHDYLNSLLSLPHFHTLGLYRNTDLVGEILMAGQGNACELVAMYIIPGCRMQGMGRALLHRSMAIMAAEGVNLVQARVMTNSTPQMKLMADFNAVEVRQEGLYPGRIL